MYSETSLQRTSRDSVIYYTCMQAFCSSITGTLATLAVLKGVGVGDSTATPLAATITWMLKGAYIITLNVWPVNLWKPRFFVV